MLEIKEAQALILKHARSFGDEDVPLKDSLRRVLATDVFADRNYPPFNRATMDGYAFRSEDFKKGKTFKLKYDLRAGDIFRGQLSAGECVRIMTGAPVPDSADVVVKSEDSLTDGDGISFPLDEVTPGQNIALCGEDMKTGDFLLSKGTLITPPQQVSLATTGHSQVRVTKLPRIGIFSTGNEVQAIDGSVLPHHIRDSNSYALYGLLQSYRIETRISVPLADDPVQLKEAFLQGLNSDILIVSGGVSKGVADYVPGVLKDLGAEELFHRVKIKPGNPLWAGIFRDRTLIFALPGNPVSVQVAFKIFIEPFIRSCFGMKPLSAFHFPIDASRERHSRFSEYFPVTLHEADRAVHVRPVPYNGSGDVRTTALSDGIALHPEDADRLERHAPVLFYPW